MFHEKPDKDIIQDDAYQDQQKITEKLHSSMETGSRKNYMPHEHKTRRETDQE